MMKNYQLKDVDIEDIEDLLIRIESSFGIKFVDNELIHIKTFGELCDHIAEKIQFDSVDDCTSQQAFYKLRKSVSEILKISKNDITPQTYLTNLFPSYNRRLLIKKIENKMGYGLNILRPPYWITNVLTIIAVASFGCLFINWKLGFVGLILSIFSLFLAYRMSSILEEKTIGGVVRRIVRENYLKSRRNNKTFNKKEIENILSEWFSKEFGINRSDLNRDTLFREM